MSNNSNKKEVVFLGLSGGVDSAVAAALLLEQGYDVRAVFLKIWSDDLEDAGYCPWVEERRDAIAIAAQLGIPIETVSFEQEYKDKVFSYFVDEYKAGRTPNPDILCNEIIKFGCFLEWALQNGADYIATGHHVQRSPESGNQSNSDYKLLRGVDKKKDQSYFLASLNQHQLSHTLFPIGKYTKDEVRSLASKYGLDSVAQKPSTKGICFVGDVNLRKFLSQYTQEHSGDILNEDGEKVGTHGGVQFYTIGQRKGLTINAVSPESKPYFVLSKNAENNTLVVSDDEHKLNQDQLVCANVHWHSETQPEFPLSAKAKIRYNQSPGEVTISQKDSEYLLVDFVEPQRAIAPGQIIAFYQDDILLGSAVIA